MNSRKLILIIAAISWTTQAAVYYVKTTGNNNNDGLSEGNAWATMAKASTVMTAGDTTYVFGGTYSNDKINPSNNGSAGNMISFIATNGAPMIANGTGIPCGIWLQNRSYIRVSGIIVTNTERQMSLYGASNNDITNCTFTTRPPSWSGWAGIVIQDNSRSNWIHNCTFDFWGHMGSTTSLNDFGTLMELGPWDNTGSAFYNLLENNIFSRGGHDLLSIGGGWNIVRSNYFHHEKWWNRGDGVLWGNRCLDTSGPRATNNLIEKNKLWHSRRPQDDEGANGWEGGGVNSIFRFNDIVDCGQGAVKLYAKWYSASDTNYVYHNSSIFAGSDTNCTVSFQRVGYWIGGFAADHAPRANRFFNNIAYKSFNNQDFGNDGGSSWTQQFSSNNWITVNGDPLFVSTNVLADKTLTSDPQLQLQTNSPCIDNGIFLTRVTSADNTGTSFTVDDPGFFFGGLTTALFTVNGDIIQLKGQTNRATLTGVNHVTKTLTFTPSLTWTNNQPLALAYSGNAPDQGAYESGVTNDPGSGGGGGGDPPDPPDIVEFTNGSFEGGLVEPWIVGGSIQLRSNSGTFPASHGTNCLTFNSGQATPSGTLSQTFLTNPGQNYQFAFDLGAYSVANTNLQTLRVVVKSSVPTTLASQDFNILATGVGHTYVGKTLGFTATTENTVLEMSDISPTTTNIDMMLDNIALQFVDPLGGIPGAILINVRAFTPP